LSARKLTQRQKYPGFWSQVVPEVAHGGIYGSRIKVHGKNPEITEGCCSQGQHSTAAASIQHPALNSWARTVLTTKEFIQQSQCKTRTRMVSIAKGLLWVDKEYLPALTTVHGLTRMGYGKTWGNIYHWNMLMEGTRGLIRLKNPEIYGQVF
jgi:hypothetical protein